jgi:hypothetical protein
VGSPVQYTNLSFSRDRQKIAYNSREPGTTAFVARLHDLTTGDDRELHRSAQLGSCILGKVSDKLFCLQLTSADGMDLITIALDTRRVEKVASLQGRGLIERIRDDDKALIILRGQSNTFYEWVFETGALRPVGGYTSEDGRLEFGVATAPGVQGFMQVRPLGGGEDTWKPLVARRMPPPGNNDGIPIKFTPDSQWIVYHDRDEAGRDGLYRVSTSGGAAERLGDYPTSSVGSVLAVAPGGDRFLVNAPPPTSRELWVLEHFTPVAKGTK